VTRHGFGSGAGDVDDEDDVGGVVVDEADEEEEDDAGGSGYDAGGLLCGCVGWAGFVVTWGCSGVPGFGCSWGRAACLRSGLADEGAPEDTVTTAVLVLPSGATLVMVWTASAAVRSGAASLPDAASMDATVANRVATTTPPAASITAVPTRFFGAADSVGDCG
jgi:hypothetical protein